MQAQSSSTFSPESCNRQPTQHELFHAATILRSLGNEALARRVENAQGEDSDEENLILVVSDFSAIGDEEVILVPPGMHSIPSSLLEPERYIIGLSPQKADYPSLILNGESSDIINTDTLEDTRLNTCQSSACLAHVMIDAPQPTVLETYFGDNKQFSDVFFRVAWGPNADALNTGAYTFFNGWRWALDAYGSLYRGRNGLETGLDGFHQGMMSAIDGTFKPLVRMGEKLDRLLGLD